MTRGEKSLYMSSAGAAVVGRTSWSCQRWRNLGKCFPSTVGWIAHALPDPEAHCVAWLCTCRAGLLAEMWLCVWSAASLFTTAPSPPCSECRDLPAGPRDPFGIDFGNNPKTLPVLFILLLCDTVASPGSGHMAAQRPSSEPTLTSGWFVLENSVDLSLKMSVQWVYC